MAMTKAPEPTSEEDGGNTIETYKSGLTIIKSVEGYISSVYGNTMIMYYPKDQLEVTYERDADQKLVEVKREENITQGEHNNNIQQYKELKQEAKSEVELMESVMTNSAKLTARKSQEVKKTDESTPTDAEIKALVKLQSVVRRRQARKHKKFIRDAKELLKQSGKEVWGFDQANTPEEQELKKLIEKTKLTSKDWGQLEELVNTLQRSNESKGAPPPKPPARIRQEVKKTDEALDDGSTKSQPAFLSDIKNLKKQPHLRTGLVSKVNELRQQYFNRQQEDGFDSDQSILNSLETLEKKGGQVTQDDIDAHETLISEPSEKEQGLFRSAMLEKARPTTGSSSIPDRGDDDDWDDDVNDQPVEAVTETPKEDAKVIFKQKINKFQDTKQRLFEDELHGKYYTHEYTTINQWAKDQEEGVESSDYDKKYKEFISKVSKIQDAVRDIKYLTNKEREDVINKALGDEEKLGFDKIKKGPKLTDNSIVKLKVMRGKVVKAATNKEVKPSNKSVIKQGLKRRFHNESTTWLDKIKEELERMEKGDDSFFGDDGMSWNDIKSGVKDIINEMKKNKMPENIVKDLNQLLNDKKYTAFIKQNDITEILGLVQESGISKENKQKAASSLEALFSKGGPAQSKKTIETNEINDVPDPTAIEKAVDPEIENKAAVKLQSVVRRRQARKQRKLISDAKELLKQSGAAELGSESPNTTKEKQLKQLIEKFNKQQKLTKSEETTLKKLVENIQEYSKSAKVESLPKIDKGILLILKTRLNTITQFVRGGGGFGRVELSGGKINTETFTIVDKLLGENKISLLQVYSEVISQDGGTLARFKSYLDKKSKKVKSDPDWNKQLEELYNKLPTESKNRDMRLLREKIKSLIPPEKKEQKKLTPDETFNPVKDLFKNDEPTIKLLDEISKEEYKDLTSVNKLRDKIIRYNKMMRFQQSRMTDQELKVQKFPEYPEYPEFILGNDHTKVFTPLLDAVDAEIKEVKLQSQSEQLINAIKTGSKDDALKLLELKGVREKADTTTNLVLKMACSKGMPEVAMKLLEQPEVSKNAHVNNNAALIRACGKGLSEVSLKLLEQPQVSKNAHAENNYALNLACKNGMQKVVKKLLGQKEVLKGVPNLLAGMEQGDAKDNLQGAFDKTKKQAGLKLCLDEFANVIDVILAKEIDFDGVEVNVNTLYNIKKNSLVDPNENIDPNENKNDSLSKARREFGKIVKEMRDLSKKGYLDTPDDIEQLMDKIAGLEKQFKIITEDVIEIVHFSGVLGNLTYEVNQPTTTKGNMDVFTMQPFQKLQLFCKDLSKQIAKCFDMQQRIKFAFEVIAKNGSDELNMAQTEVEMEKHKNDKKEFYYSTGPSRGKRYKDVLGEKSMIEGKQPVKTVGDLINIGNLYIAGYGGKDSKESAKACYQKASKILKDINVDELSPENREETEKNVEKLRAELDQLNRKISEVESNDNPDVTPEMVKSFKKVDYIPKEQFTKGENYVESDGELDLTRGLYFASKGTRDGYVTLINKNSDLLGIKEINKEDIYKDSPAANVSKKTGWFSSKEVYQGKGKGHRAALLSKMNEIKELIGSEDFNPRIHLLEGLAIAQVIKDLSEEDKQDFAKKYRSLERYSTKKGYRENLSGKIMLSSLKALSQEVYGNPDKLKDASPLDIATAVQTSQTSIQDRDLKLDESKITNDATAEELYAVGVLCFTESSKLTDSRFDKAKSKMEEKGEKYFRQALKKEKDDKSDIGYRTKRILGTGERKPKIISGSELDDRVREVDNYIFEPHGEDARSLYDDIVSGKTFAEEINDKSIKKQIDEVKKTIYSYSNSKITKILEDYCNKIKQRPFEAMAELDKKMPELKKEISDLKVDGEKQGHTDIIKELRNLGHKHIIASLQKDIPFLLRMYKGGIELSETDKSRINKKKMKKKIRLLQGKPYHDNIKAIQGMLNQDITPQERVLLYRYVLQEPPELSKNQMCCVLLESIFQENAESQHGTCPTYVALPPKDVYSKFLTKPQSMWDKFKNIFKVFSKKTGDNAENDMTVLDEHLSEKGDNVKSQAVSPGVPQKENIFRRYIGKFFSIGGAYLYDDKNQGQLDKKTGDNADNDMNMVDNPLYGHGNKVKPQADSPGIPKKKNILLRGLGKFFSIGGAYLYDDKNQGELDKKEGSIDVNLQAVYSTAADVNKFLEDHPLDKFSDEEYPKLKELRQKNETLGSTYIETKYLTRAQSEVVVKEVEKILGDSTQKGEERAQEVESNEPLANEIKNMDAVLKQLKERAQEIDPDHEAETPSEVEFNDSLANADTVNQQDPQDTTQKGRSRKPVAANVATISGGGTGSHGGANAVHTVSNPQEGADSNIDKSGKWYQLTLAGCTYVPSIKSAGEEDFEIRVGDRNNSLTLAKAAQQFFHTNIETGMHSMIVLTNPSNASEVCDAILKIQNDSDMMGPIEFDVATETSLKQANKWEEVADKVKRINDNYFRHINDQSIDNEDTSSISGTNARKPAPRRRSTTTKPASQEPVIKPEALPFLEQIRNFKNPTAIKTNTSKRKQSRKIVPPPAKNITNGVSAVVNHDSIKDQIKGAKNSSDLDALYNKSENKTEQLEEAFQQQGYKVARDEIKQLFEGEMTEESMKEIETILNKGYVKMTLSQMFKDVVTPKKPTKKQEGGYTNISEDNINKFVKYIEHAATQESPREGLAKEVEALPKNQFSSGQQTKLNKTCVSLKTKLITSPSIRK